MSYFKPYNPNPCGCRVGDCTVRAICKATGLPWEQVYCALSACALSKLRKSVRQQLNNTCIFHFGVL